MARPLASYIRLPDDAGNTGKKNRTQTRVVGSDTVHEHFVVSISKELILGMYYVCPTAPVSVQASAQNGTSTAHFWLENPTSSTRRVRVRRFRNYYDWGVVPAADVPTLPRFVLARFTFTGTASGASITPAKRASADSGNTASWRTASTGMTVTVGAVAWGNTAPFVDFATAAGINVQPREVHEFAPAHEDEFLDFDSAEGVLGYQPDAGTASDLRRLWYAAVWDECDDA